MLGNNHLLQLWAEKKLWTLSMTNAEVDELQEQTTTLDFIPVKQERKSVTE